MSKTKIEWTDRVWNPVTGCTKVSQGCKNCYAETIAKRFWGDRLFSDVQCHPDRLSQPERWRKPAKVFVNSMSDLFHEQVSDHFIDHVFNIMAGCDHTFQILTKRPERMMEYMTRISQVAKIDYAWPNVWLGVSVEDQATADERIPLLLQTPAAVRFVSCEPLLGPVDLNKKFICPECGGAGFEDSVYCSFCTGAQAISPIYRLDWVICGGESGPHARPMHPDWASSLRDQCQAAGVPFFFKQWGTWLPVCPQYPENDDDEPNLDDLDLTAHRICFGNKGTLYSEDRGLKPDYWCGYQPDPWQNPWFFEKVGKKAAGRTLGGRTWDEFPHNPRWR